MNGEIQAQIHKFIYNLSNQDFAKANENLKATIHEKVATRFSAALKKVSDNKNK